MEAQWNFICAMIHVGAEAFTVAVYAFCGVGDIWRKVKHSGDSASVRVDGV